MSPQDDPPPRKSPETGGSAKSTRSGSPEPPEQLSPSTLQKIREVVAEHNKRVAFLDGHWWQVWRQPAVAVATGYVPTAPESGLVFMSDSGERRFLPMGYPFQLPSADEFAKLTDDELRELLVKARPQP